MHRKRHFLCRSKTLFLLNSNCFQPFQHTHLKCQTYSEGGNSKIFYTRYINPELLTHSLKTSRADSFLPPFIGHRRHGVSLTQNMSVGWLTGQKALQLPNTSTNCRFVAYVVCLGINVQTQINSFNRDKAHGTQQETKKTLFASDFLPYYFKSIIPLTLKLEKNPAYG